MSSSGQWCVLHDVHQDDDAHDYRYRECEGRHRDATPAEEARVGGLTGQQLSLLRQWAAEGQCAFEFFPRDSRGPAEFCVNLPVDGSRFCEDHIPEQDEYDCYIDRGYE